MTRLLLSFFLLISIFTLNAQTQSVSIGTTDTNSKAILWLQGNGSQGLILPVASTAGFPANEAGEGSVVYDGSLQKVFYSNGVQWIDMAAGTGPGGIQTIGITGNEIILSSGGGTIGLASDAPTTSPGQLLMWNGTAWTTTSATVPTTAGQVLSWNGTSWEATTAATGGSLSADDVTIQLVSGVLAIKDGGVTDAKVAAGISGNKIAITPSGNLVSNNVQDAVAELQTDIDSKDASATNEIQEVSVISGTGTTTPGESFNINNSMATGTGVTVQEGSGIQIDRTGNQLTINSTAAGTGTVTSIATGTGLAGGPITSSGTITLANTAVTAGTFGNATSVPQIIVDQQGRITSATNVGIAAGATTLDGLSDATVTTPITGQILINNGTGQFQNISLNGDASLTNTGLVTINNNAVTSAKIADGTIAAADINAMSATNGQVLKFNGTNWLPSSDDVGGGATPTLNNGQILTGNGTSNTASALSGDATLNVGVLTISTGAVTSVKIADGTIAAVDLNSMGATNGQVLQYNGTTWAPLTPSTGATDINGLTDATIASPVAGNIIIHDGAGQFQNRALSGDATISSTGVVTIASNAVGSAEITNASIATADLVPGAVTSAIIADATITATDIAAGTITSGNIADGTIAAADLNAMSATSGQVLQFNGTSWTPITPTTGVTDINGLTDATIASPVAGNVLVHDGAGQFQNRALSGDATISSTGVLTIGNNSVGSAEITDASIATADLATGAVTSTTIADATITATDIAAGTITSGNIADGTIASTDIADGTVVSNDLGTMGATNGQLLQFDGTNWLPASVILGATDLNGLIDATVVTPASGQILINDGAGQFKNTSVTGDITISNAGLTTINANAVTTTKIAGAGVGARAILGSDNNVVNWISGTANQLLGTDGTGALQFVNKSGFVSGTLNSAEIFVGNAGNVATGVALSGDASLTNAGVLTINDNTISGGTGGKISDNTITDADVAAAAAILGTKIDPTFGNQMISSNGEVFAGSTYGTYVDITTVNSIYGNFTSVKSSSGVGTSAIGTYSAATAAVVSSRGVFGEASGAPSNYGVTGLANGTDVNYGVYGEATGGTTNWAGYFNGHVGIRGALAVGTSNDAGVAGQILSSQGPGVEPKWITTTSYTAGNGLTLTGSAFDLGGTITTAPTFISPSVDNVFHFRSQAAALNTKAGFNLRSDLSYTGTQWEVVSRKSDATANSGSSDFVISKLFSTAGGYTDMFRIENATNNVLINASKTSTSPYGNFIVANGNSGFGTLIPSAVVEIQNINQAGAGNGQLEAYHPNGFGSALMGTYSLNSDGTGQLFSQARIAGYEANPTNGSGNNIGVWGHQSGAGSGGWGVLATNGASLTAPDRYVALAGNSNVMQIVDGNQGDGKVLKSDAAGNATWSNVQTIAFSAYNGASQTLAAGWQAITFPTEEYDLSNNYGPSGFTVPANGDGIYHLIANVTSSNVVATRYLLAFYKNGGLAKAVNYTFSTIGWNSLHITADLNLIAGDTITVQLYLGSGTDATFGTQSYVYFQGRKVN